MITIIEVHVKPGARQTQFSVENQIVQAKIGAQPVDGEANKELIRALAKKLKISSANIKIKTGASSKTKLLQIDSQLTKEGLFSKLD